MRKISLVFICVLFLLLPAGTKSYRLITDPTGRKVYIPENVKRIVVLTAVCIETIYICGSIDKVVGISRSVLTNPIYTEIIKELKNLPIVATTENEVNLEKLISLNPDIVIALGGDHPGRLSEDIVKRLENMNISVVLIDVRKIEDNYRTIEVISDIVNNREKGEELINFMKEVVRKVKKETEKIPENKKVKVLAISGNDPTTVIGGYWGEHDIKVLSGGINVAEEIKQFSATVSIEKIISWNPDVILISHAATYGPEDLISNPQFRHINAVKNKRVYKNPYHIGGLFTPRVVLILSWSAKKLYPEINLNWVKITDKFFRKFYGIPYYGPKD